VTGRGVRGAQIKGEGAGFALVPATLPAAPVTAQILPFPLQEGTGA